MNFHRKLQKNIKRIKKRKKKLSLKQNPYKVIHDLNYLIKVYRLFFFLIVSEIFAKFPIPIKIGLP